MTAWTAIGALAGFQLFAVAFYFVQKSGRTVGGPISPVKSLWLTYAISLWVIGPFFFAALAETQSLREAWLAAAASMAARSVVELILCYATHSWKTEYGVAHDSFQAGMFVLFLVLERTAHPAHLLLAGLTIVSLACEVYFVSVFRRHTAGPSEGIYFVSSEESRINRITAWILLPQYAVFWAALGMLL